MTDREKLVELIRWIGMLEIEDCEYIADHLLANGVTVQRCGEGIEGPIKFAGFVKLGPEDVDVEEPDVDVVERFRQMLEDEQRTKLGGEEK